jgi:hypothetical protein
LVLSFEISHLLLVALLELLELLFELLFELCEVALRGHLSLRASADLQS